MTAIDRCRTSHAGPLCGNLRKSSACCVIVDSMTDGVIAIDSEQRTSVDFY
jgi:hypothetical protein